MSKTAIIAKRFHAIHGFLTAVYLNRLRFCGETVQWSSPRKVVRLVGCCVFNTPKHKCTSLRIAAPSTDIADFPRAVKRPHNGIDPYRYLVWLFAKLPLAATADDYAALMPWTVPAAPNL